MWLLLGPSLFRSSWWRPTKFRFLDSFSDEICIILSWSRVERQLDNSAMYSGSTRSAGSSPAVAVKDSGKENAGPSDRARGSVTVTWCVAPCSPDLLLGTRSDLLRSFAMLQCINDACRLLRCNRRHATESALVFVCNRILQCKRIIQRKTKKTLKVD